MNRIKFKPVYYRNETLNARIALELPEVKPFDINCGADIVIKIEKLSGAIATQSAESFDSFYAVTEFLGSQCNDPDDAESNMDHYYIALIAEN